MMIHYVGYSTAKPGKDGALKAFIEAEVIPSIKASEGCESCQLLQDSEDAHKFMIIEIWASLEAHKASIKNISKEAITQFMDLVAEPPSGRHYHMSASL